ncbi:tetratricopeptide repeat protein [Oxalobacter paraformigenes]|uniref:Sel1 repeat family protein n=1 Tax=Oxalobacter paraformigenes TaxID=556268 RepID=C3X3H7_9BURK|nr:tetratricopeptide repeat protein [Oxalobacter paraformigenes]EEO27763.2 hypothetical protein OFAG_00916 [Oxalobacter paraformigenes]
MKNKIFYFLILFFLSFLVSCEKKSSISSEKEGMDYYKKGEYEKALPLLEKSANSGNAKAYFYLGEIYRDKDISTSCRNYKKASEGGYKEAFFKVGLCYYVGEGIEKNDSEAFKWAKKAGDELNEIQLSNDDKKHLMLFIGDFYLTGKGTLQDFSEAAKWFEQAAELGDERAQATMAFFYYSGQGVLMSKEKSKYWAEKAAAQDNEIGEFALGMLNQFNDPPAIKEAVYWYEKAAEKNHEGAQYELGVIYEKGVGIEQDLAKAHHYYKLAATSGRSYLVEELSNFEKRHNLKGTP